MKIKVLGWANKKNIGDDVYPLAFKKLFPGIEFSFTDKLEDVSCCDAVVIGGGDVLASYFTDQIHDIQKPLFACSITASKNIDPSIHFDYVWARDNFSVESLTRQGIKAKYAPDAAFALDFNRDIGKSAIRQIFIKEDRDQYEKVVGVIINSHLLSDPNRDKSIIEYINFLKFSYEIGSIVDSVNASFIFIPFSYALPWDDRASNFLAVSQAKFWKKCAMVLDPQSVTNTLNIISACDAVISTRLHSSIFCCRTGVPFIDVTHNHKNKWFLNTINYPCSPIRSFAAEEIKPKLENMLFKGNEIRLQLGTINIAQEKILKERSEECLYTMMTKV